MASALHTLLETIKDGIVVVNLAGDLVFANAAARQSFSQQLTTIANHPELKLAIANAAIGKTPVPCQIRISLGEDIYARTTLSGTLIQAPNVIDYAFVIHTGLRSDEYTNSLHNFFELIRQELRNPVQQFLTELEKTQPKSEAGREVIDRLEKMIDLVEVFGDDALIDDERILFKNLVSEVCQDLAPIANKHRMQISLVGFSGELPPVYGSTNWLKRAVRECMENAIKHSSEALSSTGGNGNVEIRASTSGQHLMITVRNLGKGALPKISDRVFLPFNRAGIRKESPLQGLSIGLPLAQRIVQLHGGQIRILNQDDSTELIMELPTGAPKRDSTRMDIQQAQKYAEDLSKLMARRRTTPEISETTEAKNKP